MSKVNLNILIAVCVFITALAGPARAVTHYVNPNGSKDFTTIQAAIDDPCTVAGDEIEVAPGTYNEAVNFKGKAVKLYSSEGPDLTIIDGFMSMDYHVVQCVSGEDANSILEGFTITGGIASGTEPNDQRGGGMHCRNSSPMVTDCNFTGNFADYGSGMSNSNSSPTVTNCTFNSNWSSNGDGVGMYNTDNSNPTVTNCTFNGNSEARYGGGMYNCDSSPTVTDCTFSDNTAAVCGGGMYNDDSSPRVINSTFSDNYAIYNGGGMANYGGNPTVTNCTFSDNTAGAMLGGGMYNSSSSPTVTNCNFSGNWSDEGGGMYNSGSSPMVTNCTFISNSAVYGGGMDNSSSSSPTVTNCTFIDNWSESGGGIYNSSSNPTVTNCTFSVNSAVDYGGGMANSGSSPTVTNCIFWANTAPTDPEIYGNATVTYSDVQGGYAGTGNIDADPNFVDANGVDDISGTADDNLRLLSGSPCIDAGANADLETIAVDLDMKERIIDDCKTADTGTSYPGLPVIDMGAYEYQVQGDNNFDGMVNFKDLAILCNNWLAGVE